MITQESRWIVLSSDGRFATLGRHTDPSEAELAKVEANMLAQGLTGYLAILRGVYYSKTKVELMQVRPLSGASPEGWEAAVAAFESNRKAAAAA